MLEHAGELASGVLAPLNRIGDQQGSRLENGRVRTPDGFADAYRQFAQGGWQSLSADPEHGGQGLPKAMELAVFEMVNAANMAFALCPTLTPPPSRRCRPTAPTGRRRCTCRSLVSRRMDRHHAADRAAGGLGPVAGALPSAEPDGEGGYRLTGQKIFITWGDHDVADNIVGMVLARTPGAPRRGEGAVAVPLRQAAGRRGRRRWASTTTARPVSIEHKLGIHASPTCVMSFEGAKAELVGELNQGLPQMFVMMNAARIAGRRPGRRHRRARLPAGAGLRPGAPAGPRAVVGREAGGDLSTTPTCAACWW